MLGSTIRLRDGVSYGTVEDFVLNEEGCIQYVVVSHAGQYGLFPWSVARVDYSQRIVAYDVTPQVVEPLFFDRDDWPNLSDPEFLGRMREAFSPRAEQLELRLPRGQTNVQVKMRQPSQPLREVAGSVRTRPTRARSLLGRPGTTAPPKTSHSQ